MTALRAVHVVPRLVAEASGPSHTVPHLCRALVENGVEAQLHVLEPLPARSLPFPATAHQTLSLPGAYRLGVSPQMAKALDAAAREAQIIHNHSLWMMPNIYPGRAAQRNGCKLVISPRGTLEPWAWQRARWRKALVWALGQRQTLEVADLFHATADSEYEAIRGRGFKQPVAVIPNGVEIPELSKTPKTGNQRTLLFLSRIHPKKQVEMLLQVWKRLAVKHPEWRLVVAGPLDTVYARSMTKLAQELSLARVSFPGELGGEQKWRAYADADLFVLPTRSENFGLAIAEALASGTPVVTTRGAPWAELETRRCGWWIRDDQAELEAVLDRAMQYKPVELAEMGERGRQWMQQAFSWRHIGEQMAATYRWLIGEAERPECVRD